MNRSVWTLVLLSSALALRLAFLFARGPILTPDSAEYLRLAENLARHGVFSLDSGPPWSPAIRRSPGYPAFLALVAPNGDPMLAAWIQCLLDAAVAALIYRVAMPVVGPALAVVAGATYACHPGAIAAAAAVLPECWFGAVLLTALALLARPRQTIWSLLTAGALIGVAALLRPIALPLAALLPAVSLIRSGSERPVLRGWLLAVAGTALVVGPWIVRSSALAGRFVPIQGSGPVNLYVATRWDWDQGDQAALWRRFREEDPYGQRLTRAASPAEQAAADAFGLERAIANVWANPIAYLGSRAQAVPHLVLTSHEGFLGWNVSFARLVADGDLARLAVKTTSLTLFSAQPWRWR